MPRIWVPVAERSPRVRCACFARRVSAAAFTLSTPARCSARRRSKPCPTRLVHGGIDNLPPAPLLLVANEFLDALPVRQFVAGVERHVTIAAGGLAFDRDGEIVEDSPEREEAVAAVARRVVEAGGVALFIDYGHPKSAAGDTLQALRGHRFAAVLFAGRAGPHGACRF